MAIGILEVQLVNAKGLGETDFLGNMDPYVMVQYRSQERKSSVARGQGGNPTWNERLALRVEYPGQGHDYKLLLKIMDKDTFSADDFAGQATIHVEDILAIGVENGTAELHPSKYRVVRADGSYRGEIQVGLSFALKAAEDNGEEQYGGWRESSF
uniref:Elicitor-responsive protein 1-like n=1 Tax=Rhizophora mucronata TaxID=61149 RepID=A0A2P2QWR3_RHIMU